MAPLKEFQGNFASSSMPNFQPQMDFGYEIIPWLAGSFIVFVIGLIVRQISTSSSSSSDSSGNWSNRDESGNWQPIAPKPLAKGNPGEPVKDPYFSYSMRMTNGVARWIVKLISEPYTFTKQGYTRDRTCFKFYCNECYKKNPKKYTWAFAKIVGYAENNRPELELVRIDSDHVCEQSANVKFLNKLFLDRCYEAILKNPTEQLKKIFNAKKLELEAEYFTVTPDTNPVLAAQIRAQEKEWKANARNLRNMKTSLYPYRHYFIPKDPVNVHDKVRL